MERKLTELVDSLYRVADLRNLDYDNPVSIKLDSENSEAKIVIVVAHFEPWRSPLHPVNVIWLDADPTSSGFKRIRKRVSKAYDVGTPQFKHTWEELYYYRDVFHPPQWYDYDSGQQNQDFINNVLAHLGDHTNPHHTTAEQVGALALTGGTLTGQLILDDDPIIPLSAASKRYVDNINAGYTLQLQNLNNYTQSINTNLQNLENVTVQDLVIKVANHNGSISNLSTRVSTLETQMISLDTTALTNRITQLEGYNNSIVFPKISDYGARITTLETKEASLRTTVNSHGNSISALQTFQSNAEPEISNLQQRMATAEGHINTLTSTSDNHTTRITVLEGYTSTLLTQVSTLNNQVSNLETFEAWATPLLSTHTGQINVLNTYINTSTQRMNTLESQIGALQNVDLSELAQLSTIAGRVTSIENTDTAQNQLLFEYGNRLSVLEAFKTFVQSQLLNMTKKYVYTQTSPLVTWVINHNLNSVDIAVTILVSNEIIMPDSVIIVDESTVQVQFNKSTAGKALLTIF